MTEKDKNILKYQFAINFMSKKPEEVASYIEKEFTLYPYNSQEFIEQHLLPTLLLKSKHSLCEKLGLQTDLQKRESLFLQEEYHYLQSLLDGSKKLKEHEDPSYLPEEVASS